MLEELDGALKRRPSSEARLAAALRVLAPESPVVRAEVERAADVLVRRGTLDRELWPATIRALVESASPRLDEVVDAALATEDAGGVTTLSAACFTSRGDIGPKLAKVAVGGRSLVAFSAEVARVVRGESNGARLLQLAPVIKEAHRVALATTTVLPLVRATGPARAYGAALEAGFAVLRGAERHLGRWLVLAEAVVAGGDTRPIDEARRNLVDGPASSRAGWSLVVWALSRAVAERNGTETPPMPDTRPTVELVARLSDRPSAERDLSFLFRMAARGAPSSRPMLESVVRASLSDEASLRAASALAKHFDRRDLVPKLREAVDAVTDELRGLAIAALHDAGDVTLARELAVVHAGSRSLATAVWSACVLAAKGDVTTEARVRLLQRDIAE
ncbi:MAG: hypothetical protein JNM74_14245 [Myxococcales bacterium]|nr:hypothetical protein [Myxococcales bacterium]